jgi:hypothetical protein
MTVIWWLLVLGGGVVLEVIWARVWKHRVDPGRRLSFFSVFRAEYFTPPGNRMRRQALAFTGVFIALLIALSFVL